MTYTEEGTYVASGVGRVPWMVPGEAPCPPSPLSNLYLPYLSAKEMYDYLVEKVTKIKIILSQVDDPGLRPELGILGIPDCIL